MPRAARLAAALVFFLGLGLAHAAEGPCVSGLPAGKRPGPYSAVVCTGTHRGESHCFICETANTIGHRLRGPSAAASVMGRPS